MSEQGLRDSKELSKERYGRYAQGYVESVTHAKGADLEQLVAVAQPQPGWKALDVATGGGHTALRFAPLVAEVVATDLTPMMLEVARTFIRSQGVENVRFQLADAENLPFEAEQFDLVTCRIAAHHFPNVQRFLQESARVLKPGGMLLVQDHLLPENEADARYIDAFEKLRDPSHNRAYNQGEWVTMFTRAGLEVEHMEQVTKRHDFISWAKRQGCTPEVIERLQRLLVEAPQGAASWMQVQEAGTPQASFTNHHILIAGRKDSLSS